MANEMYLTVPTEHSRRGFSPHFRSSVEALCRNLKESNPYNVLKGVDRNKVYDNSGPNIGMRVSLPEETCRMFKRISRRLGLSTTETARLVLEYGGSANIDFFETSKNRKSNNVTLRLPPKLLDDIEAQVEAGEYKTTSAVVLDAIGRMLEKKMEEGAFDAREL